MNLGSTSLLVPIGAATAGFFVAALVAAGTSALVAKDSKDILTSQVGGKVFHERCSSCHSIDEGGSTGFGPNLAMIGRDAVARKPGVNAAEYILESILTPDAYREPGATGNMPSGVAAGMTLDQMRNLVAYVASIGTQDFTAADVSALEINPTDLESENRPMANLALIRHGESLFFDTLGCSSCHSIHDEPGSSLAAPSLSQAARLSPEYVIQSIREPSAVIAAGYRLLAVKTKTGVRVQGRLLEERLDAFKIMVRAKDGAPSVVAIDRADVTKIINESVSPMPGYTLSDSDESALLSFISMLEGETAE